MKKNSKKVVTPVKPELENVPEKLRHIRWTQNKFPNEIIDFVEYMADIAESKKEYDRKFIDETMVFLVDDAIKSIKATQIRKEFEDVLPVPEELQKMAEQIENKIFYMILVVDEFASEEFSKEFRKLFIMYFSK